MSLNKTRKRVIAELQQKLDSPSEYLIAGYTSEEIAQAMRGLEKICRAVAVGLSAFRQTFNEELEKQRKSQQALTPLKNFKVRER